MGSGEGGGGQLWLRRVEKGGGRVVSYGGVSP